MTITFDQLNAQGNILGGIATPKLHDGEIETWLQADIEAIKAQGADSLILINIRYPNQTHGAIGLVNTTAAVGINTGEVGDIDIMDSPSNVRLLALPCPPHCGKGGLTFEEAVEVVEED